MSRIYGAIEAGGTKFICAIGAGPEDLQMKRIATTTPGETLAAVKDFFQPHKNNLKAVGVASFGPVDLNPSSTTYGFITSTPKPGWANTNLLGAVAEGLSVPLAFNTDVNGAALGEHTWGVARATKNFIYLTIGTGIGGGAMVNGGLVEGLLHPEMGHIFLPLHPEDNYVGKCPFHANGCFEGLASGPAIAERWQCVAEDLDEAHLAWDMQAWYLARALASLVCSYSPQRIILGGGVMDKPGLLQKVRVQLKQALNGYVQHKAILQNIDDFIVAPGLGSRSGVLGALQLARNISS